MTVRKDDDDDHSQIASCKIRSTFWDPLVHLWPATKHNLTRLTCIEGKVHQKTQDPLSPRLCITIHPSPKKQLKLI